MHQKADVSICSKYLQVQIQNSQSRDSSQTFSESPASNSENLYQSLIPVIILNKPWAPLQMGRPQPCCSNIPLFFCKWGLASCLPYCSLEGRKKYLKSSNTLLLLTSKNLLLEWVAPNSVYWDFVHAQWAHVEFACIFTQKTSKCLHTWLLLPSYSIH